MLKHDYIDSGHLLPKDLDRNENLESKNGDGRGESVYETIVIDTVIEASVINHRIVESTGYHVEGSMIADDIAAIADLESVSSLNVVVLHGLAAVIL